MDVLFGSIDVRELLSFQDCEESSPLSAPDLRILIDRLQVRSLQIKDKVRDYVLSHRQDLLDIFSRCSDAVSRSEFLSCDITQVLLLLSGEDGERPIDVEIHDIALGIRTKKRELEERKEALAVVRVVSSLFRRLMSAREDLHAGRLVSAAEAVRDLKVALLVTEDDANRDGEPFVFGLLKTEWTHLFNELQENLTKLVGKAIQFDPECGILRVSSQLSTTEMGNVKLQMVLDALDIIGVLDYGLKKVADLMVKHVVIPLVTDELVNISTEEIDLNAEGIIEAVLKLVECSPTVLKPNQADIHIYSRLSESIKFVQKYICYKNGKWMSCFGRLTWPRIAELIITSFLSKAVPDDVSKISEFQHTIKSISVFEAFLKDVMFISGSDIKEERLSYFAHNVEVHFASRKRKEILAKARDIVLQCDFDLSFESKSEDVYQIHGSTGNLVNLLFLSERCITSKVALLLMELVHQALKDACFSSTRVAMEFYHAARDSLLLYKAIVPMKMERQLETVCQAAIVMHNDFLYLAQEIAGLAFEYRPYLPNDVKEVTIFIDLTLDFRQMAEDILQTQVQLAHLSLKQAIDGANGYQNTHLTQQYDLAKFSIDQVVFLLEKVHIVWQPVLPNLTYKRYICELLETVFSRLTNDILLLDDIAAEESLQLQRLIHMALENICSLVDCLQIVDSEKGYPDDFLQRKEMIISLSKIRKLADLLDMSLKSITTAWESGELTKCGFTAYEVQRFIKAIFTDSSLRKDCLLRIENSAS